MSEEHRSQEHHSHRRKKKKRNRALQLTLVILLCIGILAVMALITYGIISYIGGENLKKQATTQVPQMAEVSVEVITENIFDAETEETTSQAIEEKEKPLQDGQIRYQDKVYQYNKDIRTFAILGIDTMGTVEDLLADEMGGQSDMIFLAVLNPHKKIIQLIAINRNTMAEIDRYATDGSYYDTVTAQLTLQHAYGTGGADSCERMVKAIDQVMYMVPIHGYFAMNMGAISRLNDAVGGVTVTALEDVVTKGTNIKAGEKITLLGKDAFHYTKYRDWRVAESADRRLDRQKQYLNAFFHKTKQMVKNDLSIPLKLYEIVADYSVTDVTVDEMSYLVSWAIGFRFNSDCIYSVPGTTVQGDGEYEEFYVDEQALYDLIVKIFYEPVEE